MAVQLNQHESSSTSVWGVAFGVTSIFVAIALVALNAVYNSATQPKHSDSWDGPLDDIPTACMGPVSYWVKSVNEHRESKKADDAHTSACEHFVSVVLPWHFQNRPFLLFVLSCVPFMIFAAAYEFRLLETRLGLR